MSPVYQNSSEDEAKRASQDIWSDLEQVEFDVSGVLPTYQDVLVIVVQSLRDLIYSFLSPVLEENGVRRINHAFELVGVELNPGPKSMALVTMGQRSLAEIKGALSESSSLAKGKKKKKSKKANLPTQAVQRRTGGHIRVSNPDMRAYYEVLSNPWDMVPVRLGGECMAPTGIATLVSRFTQTCSAAGNMSVVFWPTAGNTANNPVLFSTTASSPYTYANLSIFNGSTSLAAIATGGRVVAAGIRCVSLNSSTNNQGIIHIGCLPREAYNGSASNTVNGFPFVPSTTATQGFNEFANYLSTESYPLKCGASAVYRPQDPLDFTFRALIVDGYEADSVDVYQELEPFFVVGITGAASSSPMFFEISLHIEYTVSEGSTGVIGTGMGKLSAQGIIDTAKEAFNGLVDSTFEGVSGGLRNAATTFTTLAAANLARQAAAASGAYFSSTVF
jgi:hypothetical protein